MTHARRASKGSTETILKRIPVHGGTPTVGGLALPICGYYANFTNDAANFYYYEHDTVPSATAGIYSFALAGTSASPVQISASGYNGPMASDGSYLYICDGVILKLPVIGGTARADHHGSYAVMFGIARTTRQHVRVLPRRRGEGGVWTINKSP